MSDIHPTAVVHEDAAMGIGVSIGAFSIIGSGVTLGDEVSVGSHCTISTDGPAGPTTIGARSLIRSHCVIYRGVSIGSDFSTGHHVTVREGSVLDDRVRLGTFTDVQGRCSIGHDTRLHSNVFIPEYSSIGNFVWIFPHVVLTNDPHPPSDDMHVGVTLKDYCSIAASAVIFPGVTIGEGALVGASSLVTRDVRPGAVVAGTPAVDRGDASDLALTDGSGPAYPWRRHFHRGYPEEIVAEWREEFDL